MSRFRGGVSEGIAALWLILKGYRVLHRNVRVSGGELDLVCRKRSSIVFVEVKYRRNDRYGNAESFVHERKQALVKRAALGYMNRMRINPEHQLYRFDVIAIDGFRIRHIQNAFS